MSDPITESPVKLTLVGESSFGIFQPSGGSRGKRWHNCSAATGFSAKTTRFTKKVTRSQKNSLYLKYLRRSSQFCLK